MRCVERAIGFKQASPSYRRPPKQRLVPLGFRPLRTADSLVPLGLRPFRTPDSLVPLGFRLLRTAFSLVPLGLRPLRTPDSLVPSSRHRPSWAKEARRPTASQHVSQKRVSGAVPRLTKTRFYLRHPLGAHKEEGLEAEERLRTSNLSKHLEHCSRRGVYLRLAAPRRMRSGTSEGKLERIRKP